MSRANYTRVCLAKHAVHDHLFAIEIVAALFIFAAIAALGV